MNIFNRRELLITMESTKLSQVLNTLDENKIKYQYKTFNTCGANSGTTRAIGLDKRQRIQYYIYVHKNDLEKAKYLINKI